MRKLQTEVLVVGAGPVGLASALLLAETGAEVQIIDREYRTAARSYACALHPSTLRILDRLGLASKLIEQGRQVRTIGLYEGQQRRAVLDLAEGGGDFPYLLIVPQSRFRQGAIGLSMVPRGEIGLIFAQLGLNQGILDAEIYAALLIVIALTTIAPPFLLKAYYGRRSDAAA